MAKSETEPSCKTHQGHPLFEYCLDGRYPTRVFPTSGALEEGAVKDGFLVIRPSGPLFLDRYVIVTETRMEEFPIINQRRSRQDVYNMGCMVVRWINQDKRTTHWHLTIDTQIDGANGGVKATLGGLSPIEEKTLLGKLIGGYGDLPYCKVSSDDRLTFGYRDNTILVVNEDGLELSPYFVQGELHDTKGKWEGGLPGYRLDFKNPPYNLEFRVGALAIGPKPGFGTGQQRLASLIYGIRLGSLDFDILIGQISQMIGRGADEDSLRTLVTPYLRLEVTELLEEGEDLQGALKRAYGIVPSDDFPDDTIIRGNSVGNSRKRETQPEDNQTDISSRFSDRFSFFRKKIRSIIEGARRLLNSRNGK